MFIAVYVVTDSAYVPVLQDTLCRSRSLTSPLASSVIVLLCTVREYT